jgi:uncharacterized Zn finger protein (UPF0148 family)
MSPGPRSTTTRRAEWPQNNCRINPASREKPDRGCRIKCIENSATNVCVACGRPLVEGGDFCPFCGTQQISLPIASAVDTYIKKKLDTEISTRFTDQKSLVREIGDQAEEVLWKRLRLFSLFLGAILAFFAFEGVKTLRDVRSKIEPIVSSAEQKAQDTKRTVDGFAGRVNSVKASLDALTHEVDVQEKRVTASGVAGLSIKISKLQEDTGRLQNTVGTLGSTVGNLSSKVQQVSTQVDTASIRQA